jgi:hypothetical protein
VARNIRAYPPGSHTGIVIFRLDVQSARAVIAAVEDLVTHHDLADLAGVVAVAHRGLLPDPARRRLILLLLRIPEQGVENGIAPETCGTRPAVVTERG